MRLPDTHPLRNTWLWAHINHTYGSILHAPAALLTATSPHLHGDNVTDHDITVSDLADILNTARAPRPTP
jgi:hypothetical protein